MSGLPSHHLLYVQAKWASPAADSRIGRVWLVKTIIQNAISKKGAGFDELTKTKENGGTVKT